MQRRLGDEVLRGQLAAPPPKAQRGQKGKEWNLEVGHKWGRVSEEDEPQLFMAAAGGPWGNEA